MRAAPPRIAADGFLTGLLLQLAVGPVFFFVLDVSLRAGTARALVAVAGVALADYGYIALALLGVGRLLEHGRLRRFLGISGAALLLLLGLYLLASALATAGEGAGTGRPLPSAGAVFLSAFLLTASSPLTILFWTGLFSSKAVERGYAPRQLLLFGLSAGLATVAFLGAAALVLSALRASVPPVVPRILNAAVAVVLTAYGAARLLRTARKE